MRVPLLDLKRGFEKIRREIQQELDRIFDEQSFILGPVVRELEEDIKRYLGVYDAIGVASGTDALLLSLMVLDIKPNDEVITTPFTFFATASSIARLNAKPVFADIDISTFNISTEDIARKITKNTKAIIPVHLFGLPADMEEIMEIASIYNIKVLEDSAQAFGAEYKGKKVGTIGDISAFSFYPTKNLGGAGDGGLITTNNPEYANKARILRVHGSEKRYFHKYIGINSRLDSIQAAILKVKLKYIDQYNNDRYKNAQLYKNLLKDLEQKEYIKLPLEKNDRTHIYHQFTIRVLKGERDKLRDFLQERGIGTEIYYPLPLHLQECFKYLGYREGDLPNAELASKQVLSLPMFPELTKEEIEYVVENIYEFYGKKS